MKIYTKTGDTGSTGLLGGKRVSKDSLEINAIGEVDELNSCIGILVEEVEDDSYHMVVRRLRTIQNDLFTIGSMIAGVQTNLAHIPKIKKSDITRLERWIDVLSSELPPLTQFILPGGGEAASYAFFVRGVCRRAERGVVGVHMHYQELSPYVVQYLNRLSDALFVLARWLNYKEGVDEIIWKKPR